MPSGAAKILPWPLMRFWQHTWSGSGTTSQRAVEGIARGYEDVKAGRTKSAAEMLNDLRLKHDLPR